MERLPSYGPCFFCGQANPAGVQLKIYLVNGEIRSQFQLREEFVGYKGMIHGGIIAGILDEVMWWAASWQEGRACLTVEMKINYLRPTPIGRSYLAVAQVLEVASPRVITKGEIREPEGDRVYASSQGVYHLLSGRRNEEALRLVDFSLCSPEIRQRYGIGD